MKRIIVYADFQLIVNGAWESSWSAVSRKGEHYYQRIQTMTLQEAIEARHSVRAYKKEPLAEDVVKALEERIAVLNREGKLHMQLILNEPKAFQGTMAKYGKFRNANNYIVMAAKKGFSMIGYTKMDLGIAKYHFEIGAGKEHFEWV